MTKPIMVKVTACAVVGAIHYKICDILLSGSALSDECIYTFAEFCSRRDVQIGFSRRLLI